MSTFQRIGNCLAAFVLISIFFEYASAAPSKDYSNICVNHPPTQTTKTSNDSKWSNENKSNKRHVLWASKNARTRVASVLKGMAVDDAKEDYSKMCPYATIKYLQGHAEFDFYGYGTKEVDYMCAVAAGTKGALDCSMIHSNGYALKAVVYPHYDDRTVTTTWCFEDGDVGWIVWAMTDDLTPEEDRKAMEYLGSTGFDTKDKVPMTVGNCDKV